MPATYIDGIMFVSSGGGTVYTTDLKSVGASLTSSNLVWRIWFGSIA